MATRNRMGMLDIAEKGNVKFIYTLCQPAPKIPMTRFEAFFDFFSQEPLLIHLQKTESSESIPCEPILRFSIDYPNRQMASYTIFCDEREEFEEGSAFVLRYVLWDKKKEMGRIKSKSLSREELLLSLPSIETKTVVTFDNPTLIQLLKASHVFTSKGILLEKTGRNDTKWGNIYFMQRYDWGQVSATWGPYMENSELEGYLFHTAEVLEKICREDQPQYHAISLDYSYPPEDFFRLNNGTYSSVHPNK